MFSKGLFLTLGNRSMAGTASELPFPPTSYLYGHDSEFLPEPALSRLVGPKPHTRFGYAILRATAAEDSILRLFHKERNLSIEFLLLARQPQEIVFYDGYQASWEIA